MRPTTPRPRSARARLAVAGARAVTEGRFERRRNTRGVLDVMFLASLLLGLGTALVALSGIILWALVKGWPMLSTGLITNYPSSVNIGEAGYRSSIVGSLYLIAGVVVLVVPVGVGAALYLEELADRRRWWNRLIEVNIQNLAGVPSIVFGILGLAFVVRGPLSLNFVVAAGSITLAMLVLPTVILASREAIRAVPQSVRHGALALGATRWQAVSRQVIPAAIPGILTGVILAVARAIGEAAPLLLVGAATFVTFDPEMWSGRYSALPVQIFTYASRPQEEFRILAAAGVIVMLGVLLVMNAFAIWLRDHFERRL